MTITNSKCYAGCITRCYASALVSRISAKFSRPIRTFDVEGDSVIWYGAGTQLTFQVTSAVWIILDHLYTGPPDSQNDCCQQERGY